MTAAPKLTAQLSVVDRFLPVWIFVAMGLGIGLGRVYPAIGPALDMVKVGGVSHPRRGGEFRREMIPGTPVFRRASCFVSLSTEMAAWPSSPRQAAASSPTYLDPMIASHF